MDTLLTFLHNQFANFAPFFILLGVLIFVHEMGHFLVAKFFGVRVEVFSMGFGKRILSWKRGDTTYCLSIIPVGGYVKMYGDDPNAQIPESEKRFSYLHKPVAQRFAVVLAGPLMNLFFAIFIFSMIVAVGTDVPAPILGDVTEASEAYKDGLRSGDKVVQVNGESTPTWDLMQKKIEAAGGSLVNLSVERAGSPEPVRLQVPVVYGENENIFSHSAQVGRVPGLTQESRSTVVGIKDPHSPAALAGLQTLNLVTALNGEKVSYWRDLPAVLRRVVKADAPELEVQVRDMDKMDKAESLRTVKIPLQGWDRQQDLLTWLGLEPAELYIYQIKEKSPADRAGLHAKDKIVRIGQDPINSWSDVLSRVKNFDVNSSGLDFVVVRDGEEKTFTIKPEMTTTMSAKGQEEHRFTIGIVSGFFPVGTDSVFYRLSNPVEILRYGLTETWHWNEFVVMSMVRLIQGQVSARNLGGVITIGRVASHSFAAGMSTFLLIMGVISINLFLINLMPIPVLDGGHLLFYTIEILRGGPISIRKMEIAQQVGMMLLMFLMAFAFFNDITNYFFGSW